MTPKQEQKIRNNIKKIKTALAADKKHWGGYHHDGQGLRYLPPNLYLQLNDFAGGLRYLNWFHKNFPDDIGYPDFLFECTVILYKTGRLKQAARHAFKTFTGNTYLFDKFFDRPIVSIDKWEGSNWEGTSHAAHFQYNHQQENLSDFGIWLENLIQSEKFRALTATYIEIHKKLKYEVDRESRHNLTEQAHQLEKKL